eukprot:CAMPEP_0115294044 /NCGR_PEP_ID=MMETSP0270-20121206/65980_1 /TAXON_ID=71861 /ORGANISM="Scrippsiella trochoidea, Strain CCMP3099" /LENGTH=108 /DNA_ID=CAMNT_0002711559 /DNA_START=136 /DNA_END=459 /DNA_ORIENTATION=-
MKLAMGEHQAVKANSIAHGTALIARLDATALLVYQAAKFVLARVADGLADVVNVGQAEAVALGMRPPRKAKADATESIAPIRRRLAAFQWSWRREHCGGLCRWSNCRG